MRKYSTLILSFIFTVIVFIALILVQKSILNKEELIQAYVVNQDIGICDNITKDMLDTINISNSGNISVDIFKNIDMLENVVANKNLSKGKIMLNQDLLSKSELENYINEVYTQKVIIPISNFDNGINSIVKSNSYINIYVTVDSENEPDDIDEYEKVSLLKNNKNTTTFLYIEKVKPICFLDDNGIVSNSKGVIKSAVLEVNKKKALYINYIKGKAGFNITAI